MTKMQPYIDLVKAHYDSEIVHIAKSLDVNSNIKTHCGKTCYRRSSKIFTPDNVRAFICSRKVEGKKGITLRRLCTSCANKANAEVVCDAVMNRIARDHEAYASRETWDNIGYIVEDWVNEELDPMPDDKHVRTLAIDLATEPVN